MTTYSAEVNIYNPEAIADAVDEAGETASTYITEISGGGIQVHPASNTSDYTQIDANGVKLYKGGVQVASFGESVTVGKENSTHIALRNNGIAFADASGGEKATLSYVQKGDIPVYWSYKTDTQRWQDGVGQSANALGIATLLGYMDGTETWTDRLAGWVNVSTNDFRAIMVSYADIAVAYVGSVPTASTPQELLEEGMSYEWPSANLQFDNTEGVKQVMLRTNYGSSTSYDVDYIPTVYQDMTVGSEGFTIDTPLNVGGDLSVGGEAVFMDNVFMAKMAGIIQMFAGATPPAGWLVCDGSAVSRTVYAVLYAAIGDTWGAGNGSTTFNLPDLRGRAPIGAGQGTGLTDRALGTQNIGTETHKLTTGQTPLVNHSHTLGHYTVGLASNSWAGEVYSGTMSGSGYKIMQFASSINWTSKNSTNANTWTENTAHPNMQPSAVVNFIICTGKTS